MQIQHPLTDPKMELFAKLLTTLNFKLFSRKSIILDVSEVLSSSLSTINQMFLTENKRVISRFFGTVALTTWPRFY